MGAFVEVTVMQNRARVADLCAHSAPHTPNLEA